MSKIDSLNYVASKLSINPTWLEKVINLESGFNPKAVGKLPSAPNSYPKGLIQFTDSTARGLGFKDSLDLITQYPDIDSQLKVPVYNYLKQFKPFKDEGDFYLSIFLPASRTIPRNALLSEVFRKNNPGINTPQDYINRVMGIKVKVLTGITSVIILLVGTYFFFKR